MRGARAGGRRRTPSRSPHLVDRNPSAGRPRPRGRSHFRVAEERGRRGEETSFPPSFVRSRGEEDDAQRLGFPQRGCPQCRSSPVFHVPIRQSQPDNFRSHNYRNVSRHLDNRRQQGSRAHSLPENSSRNSSRNDNISRDSRFRDNHRLRESRSHLLPPVRPRTTLLPPMRSTPMTKKLKQSPLPRTRTPPPQLLKLLPPMPPSQEQSLPGTYLGSETLPPDHKGVGAKDSDVRTYVQVVKQRPTRHYSQTYYGSVVSATPGGSNQASGSHGRAALPPMSGPGTQHTGMPGPGHMSPLPPAKLLPSLLPVLEAAEFQPREIWAV